MGTKCVLVNYICMHVRVSVHMYRSIHCTRAYTHTHMHHTHTTHMTHTHTCTTHICTTHTYITHTHTPHIHHTHMTHIHTHPAHNAMHTHTNPTLTCGEYRTMGTYGDIHVTICLSALQLHTCITHVHSHTHTLKSIVLALFAIGWIEQTA